MRARWKILVPLAMVVPLVAFLVGSLVASAADTPARRDTIVIPDPPPSAAPVSPTSAPAAPTEPTAPALPGPTPSAVSDDATAGTTSREDDGVEDVRPTTDDLSGPDDRTDDRTDEPGGRDDDDHSGRGRGGDSGDDRGDDPADDHGGSGRGPDPDHGSSGGGDRGRG